MSLNVSRVWLCRDGQEILVSASEIRPGDCVIVRMGNVIPFDGIVVSGDGMINQASLTGESLPVHKEKDGYVYAGTVVEEGEIILRVQKVTGATAMKRL